MIEDGVYHNNNNLTMMIVVKKVIANRNRNRRNRKGKGSWIIFIRKMMRLIQASILGPCRSLRNKKKLRKRSKCRREISFNGFSGFVKLRNLYQTTITQSILRDLHHRVQGKNSVKSNRNRNRSKSKNKRKYQNKSSHKNQKSNNNN